MTKESRPRPFSRGAAVLLLLCAALASTHADAQSRGGRGGGGRKGGQQPTTEQPATPVTPAPAAAPLPWPRLESGALLCSSREDLIKYQTQTSGTAAPGPTVAKLMKSLHKAGLVASRRGAGGGYALGRKPSQITIADVIQAVEGPIALTACADTSDEHCSIEKLCPVQGKWNRVNAAVRAALSEVTLADMAADMDSFGHNFIPREAPAMLAE